MGTTKRRKESTRDDAEAFREWVEGSGRDLRKRAAIKAARAAIARAMVYGATADDLLMGVSAHDAERDILAPRRAPGEADPVFMRRARLHSAREWAYDLVERLERHAIEGEDPDAEHALAAVDAARAEDGDRGMYRLLCAVTSVFDTAQEGPSYLVLRESVSHAVHASMSGRPAPPAPPPPNELDAFDAAIVRAVWWAPELACIPHGAWLDALGRWPGMPQGRGGARPRLKGTKLVTWYRVVFDLLKPYGLAGRGDTAESLKKTYEAERRRDPDAMREMTYARAQRSMR